MHNSSRRKRLNLAVFFKARLSNNNSSPVAVCRWCSVRAADELLGESCNVDVKWHITTAGCSIKDPFRDKSKRVFRVGKKAKDKAEVESSCLKAKYRRTNR